MAQNRIRGITIEIFGDTTKLTEHLKKVYSEASKTEKSLKDINNALKFNPQSTELLRQKQEALRKTVEDTRQKVAGLKDSLGRLQQGDDTQKNREAQDKLQREIAETEGKLKDAEKELRNFGSVGAQQAKIVGDKMKEAGDNIKNAGKKLSKYVTTPIVTGMGASVKATTEYESAFAGVRKTVDTSEENFDRLSDSIKEMSVQTGLSKEDIAGVMEIAGQLGIEVGKDGENMSKFTRTMVDLGQSTNLTSEEAATALSRFMNVTGESQGHVDRLGSAVVDLGNNYATTEPEILNMAQNLAAAGTLAGMSSADILGISTALSAVGIPAEKGGTAVSKTMRQINDAVLSNSESLGDFAKVAGMSAEEFAKKWKEDPAQAFASFTAGLGKIKESGGNVSQTLKDLGIKNERQIDTMSRLALNADGMSAAIDDANAAYKDNTALTEEANKRYETLENKIKGAKEAIKNMAISIGETLAPYVEKATDKIKQLADWVSNLSPQQQKVLLIIAAVVAAIGPLLVIIGTLASSIGNILALAPKFAEAGKAAKGAFSAMSTAGKAFGGKITTFGTKLLGIGKKILTGAKALWGVLMANPIILVVAAVAGLVAGFIYLWNHCEGFREFWINLWEAIKEKVSTAIESIKAFIEGLKTKWIEFKDHVSETWENIKTAVGDAIEAVKTKIHDTIEAIKQFWIDAWTAIKTTVETVWNAIKTAVQTVIDAIRDTIITVLTNIYNGAMTIWGWFKDGVRIIFDAVKGYIQKSVDGWKRILETVKAFVQKHLIDPFNNAKKRVTDIFESIRKTIKDKIDRAKDAVKNAVDKIKNLFNFDFSLPDLKLPHIVVGEYIDVPVLGTIPNPTTLRVDWYKKAYDNIYGFTKPTVIPTASGYKGFGDGHGAEFVMGANKLREIAGDNIDVTINVAAQPGQNLNELANIIEAKMVQKVRREKSVFA